MKRFATGLLLGIVIGPPVWALTLWAIGPLIVDRKNFDKSYVTPGDTPGDFYRRRDRG